MNKYLLVALISMVPLIELRGAVPIAMGMDLDYLPTLVVCCLSNMLPVPLIYFFARKVLLWGANKKYIYHGFVFWRVQRRLRGRGNRHRDWRF